MSKKNVTRLFVGATVAVVAGVVLGVAALWRPWRAMQSTSVAVTTSSHASSSAPVRTRQLAVLTDRERDVLALMAEGRSNKAICAQLFLSPKTVEAHVKHIFMKLGINESPDDHRRVRAVLAYLRS